MSSRSEILRLKERSAGLQSLSHWIITNLRQTALTIKHLGNVLLYRNRGRTQGPLKMEFNQQNFRKIYDKPTLIS
ncbi:hypothetical protein [Leptospira interrogans]|uniref:hypothetical protein n=1 Tax=Leptospira interrogans TaxID=173 RepID=UPI000A9ECBE6|nr:hypothetical protein [Leptospira interrogans]QYY59646.1 hypothetical protein GR153_013575 [Leptospira interrogans serovar Bataviae]